jgi:hypothetical protein
MKMANKKQEWDVYPTDNRKKFDFDILKDGKHVFHYFRMVFGKLCESLKNDRRLNKYSKFRRE